MQLEYTLALEVTQALLSQLKSLPRCCFDVAHERAEVNDPGIITRVVGAIRFARLALENVDGVGLDLVGDGDRGGRLQFIFPAGEEVDADLELVIDGRDLLVLDSVSELIEKLFGEEALVPEWALWMFGSRMEGRHHRISKAAVVSVLTLMTACFLARKGVSSRKLRPARGVTSTSWRSVLMICFIS